MLRCRFLLSILLLAAVNSYATSHFHYDASAIAARTEFHRDIAIFGAGQSVSSFINIPNDYQISQITADSGGNTYVAGFRVFTTLGDTITTGPSDILIAKLDPAGHTVFVVTMSGKGVDKALAISVDPAGNIYVGGTTTSQNFPLRNAIQGSACPNGTCGFIVKLSPDGSQIIYSTYFGGAKAASSVTGIAVDASGNAYVTGSTTSSDYPHTSGLPAATVGPGLGQITGTFFAKISPAGDSLLYSGLIAGVALGCQAGSSCFLAPRFTTPAGIALDSTGNAYIGGTTNTLDLAAGGNAFLGKGVGPFVAKINAAGNAILSLTFLSVTQRFSIGDSPSTLSGIAVDAADHVFVTGYTGDPNFPVTAGALRTSLNALPPPKAPMLGANDGFVVSLTADLTHMLWATYLGGSSSDTTAGIAVDPAGTIWVSGSTVSSDFPNANGWTTGSDFVVGLNSTGSALTYSSLFPGNTAATISAGTTGSLHAAGGNGLVSTILTKGAATFGDIFVVDNAASLTRTQLSPGEIIAIYGQNIGSSAPATATPSAAGFFPTSLSGVQVTVNGALAPLLYTSPNQINAIVPLGLKGLTASVQVTNPNRTTANFVEAVIPASPGIFRTTGGAVMLNQDGTLNSNSNPAARGSTVAIWVTGVAVDPALKDGQIQPGALQTFCCRVYVNNQSVSVLYAGDAPSTVAGLTQINFQVPAIAGSFSQVAVADGGTATGFDSAFFYVK